MTKLSRVCLLILALPVPALAQSGVLAPADNLVTDGVPPVPVRIAGAARRYGDTRAAAFWDWHPTLRPMLVGPRLADAEQLHHMSFPRESRTHPTLLPP